VWTSRLPTHVLETNTCLHRRSEDEESDSVVTACRRLEYKWRHYRARRLKNGRCEGLGGDVRNTGGMESHQGAQGFRRRVQINSVIEPEFSKKGNGWSRRTKAVLVEGKKILLSKNYKPIFSRKNIFKEIRLFTNLEAYFLSSDWQGYHKCKCSSALVSAWCYLIKYRWSSITAKQIWAGTRQLHYPMTEDCISILNSPYPASREAKKASTILMQKGIVYSAELRIWRRNI